MSCHRWSWRRREQAHTCKVIATNFQLGNNTGTEFPFTDIVYNMITHIIYAVKTNIWL